MASAIRFIASYLIALAAIAIVIGVTAVLMFEIGSISQYLALLGFAVSVVALFAFLPAIVAVWLKSKENARLLPLQFGWLGMIVGFLESVCFMWVAYNGHPADGARYIFLLSAAGFVGGGTLAIIWNQLANRRPKMPF